MASITQNLMTSEEVDMLLEEFAKAAPENPSKGEGFGSMYLETSIDKEEIICWIENWSEHDTIGYGAVNRRTKQYREEFF